MTDNNLNRTRIDVNKIIKDEVRRLDALFKNGAEITGTMHTPFLVEDFTYLRESREYFGDFSVPFFLTYSVLKDVENRIINPYPGAIWYWIKGTDKTITKDFLPTQSKLMYDTLNSYIALLKSRNHLQALIIFRSYIEYSSQFYAALLDYDFFEKYTDNGLLDDDYKRLWFSTLKPAKVLSKIKKMHSEIDQLLKANKITYNDKMFYTRMFKPFDSQLRGFLYDKLSGLAHGSYQSLLGNDETTLYALVWLCTAYLVESHVVIDELTSVYFQYSPKELFTKWITIEIYLKSRQKNTELFV